MRFRNFSNYVDLFFVFEEWLGRRGEDFRGKEVFKFRDILFCLVSSWDYVGFDFVCIEKDLGVRYR